MLGQRIRPMETVTRVGQVLGLKKTTAFKRASSWPCDGGVGERLVIVPALARQLGIPYEVEVDEVAS